MSPFYPTLFFAKLQIVSHHLISDLELPGFEAVSCKLTIFFITTLPFKIRNVGLNTVLQVNSHLQPEILKFPIERVVKQLICFVDI